MSYSGFVPKEKRTAFFGVLGTLRGGELTGGVGTLRAERRVGTAVGAGVGTLRGGAAVGAMVGVGAMLVANLGERRRGAPVGVVLGSATGCEGSADVLGAVAGSADVLGAGVFPGANGGSPVGAVVG
jgi:hypothetical protein